VFIPEGVTESTLKVLRDEDAEVVVIGKFYAEALKAAVEMTKRDPRALLVEAYNDPLLWEGHGSMIKEIQAQIPNKPSAIFCSVGGAGMLGGVLEGCRAVGWEDGM
jgi:L-serine/L-threonine ammonia-lyase